MLRFLCRWIGTLFVAVGIVAAVVDGTRSVAASELVMTPLGQSWYSISQSSLNAAQAAIQRHVHPAVWDPVIQYILLTPTWVVACVLGLLFLVIGRRRRKFSSLA